MIEMIGKKFNRLTCIKETGRDKWNNKTYLFRCVCGEEINRSGYLVRKNEIKSCGCLFRETRTTVTRSHGRSYTREHGIWATMKSRCLNPNVKSYDRYGGRGIRVCQGWMRFEQWHADMGDRPSAKHMIERRDNNGHYSCGHCEECVQQGWPANCYWATRAQQVTNKENNRLITANGKTQHLAAWARELGCTPGAITYRLNEGWSEEEAITVPVDLQATLTAMRSTPEWRAAQSARLKAYYAKPGTRQKTSTAVKAALANPEIHAKLMAGQTAARAARGGQWGRRTTRPVQPELF